MASRSWISLKMAEKEKGRQPDQRITDNVNEGSSLENGF
jgi:hypothetical protein